MASVASVDFEVEAADSGAEEVPLVVPEEVHWVGSCTDRDRSPRHPHLHCSGRCDLVEAQKELEARREVHLLIGDWELVEVEVAGLHAELSVAKAGCLVVRLESELMMARRSHYHQCSLLAYETSEHLYALLPVQCRCRNHPRSQSRPQYDPPLIVALLDEKVPV